MAKNWLLKIIIFAILWVVGMFLFADFGGAIGIFSGMLFIGNAILGSNLVTDGNDVAGMLIAFVVTIVVYYILTEIITYLLLKLFGKK